MKANVHKASLDYAQDIYSRKCDVDRKTAAHIMKAFRDGANFALNSQWIDVSDELPKEGEGIFIADRFGNFAAWECTNPNNLRGGVITHWMRIPPTPSV